ncbi:hypothetical protein [Dyella terrae]|uniref:hypothetical protein n=1 Tax=Dyella terrae TaxID=522259 RepID=UPI001EFCA063|nr:hypothetical protein [Dyella terrae]
MRQKFFIAGITLLAGASIIPATDGHAQVADSVSSNYAKAIFTVIQWHWERYSFSAELEPGSACTARIIQLRGGDIQSVEILPECDFNEAGRADLVDAVRQSGPLPYHGFENVYQREIQIVFHPASASDRQARAASQASKSQIENDSAKSDKQWEATVGLPMQRAEYAKQCSFHLLWDMPRIKLQHPVEVVVSVDESGKVVRATGAKGEPIDQPLFAALSATPPCDHVPADLMAGADTLTVGPMTVRNFGE